MSLQVGDLFAVLRLQDDQYQRAMREAGSTAEATGRRIEGGTRGAEQSTRRVGEEARRAGGGFQSFGEMAKKGLAVLGISFGAEKLISFFKSAIDGASDLGESTNKVAVIFKEGAPSILKFGETAAKSLGLSNGAAREAAAGFGVVAKSAGMAGQDAADFAIEMTTLAGDLASFNNTSPEQAVEAIGAALRGEAEPIRAYGVLLDDASLRQEALAQGLIKTTNQALTPQQKVLATHALILKATSDAQGDFGRTSDGLANQTRIASAEFENMQAKVGEGLLPVWQKLIELFSTYGLPAISALGSAFNGLLTLLAPVLDALAGLIDVVVDLPPGLLLVAAAIAGWALFGTISTAITAFGGAVVAAGVAVKGFVASMGVTGVILTALGVAFAFLTDTSNETEEAIQVQADRWDRLKGTLDSVTGAVTEATRAQIAQEAQADGTLTMLEDLGIKTKLYVDASAGVPGAQEKLAAAVAGGTATLTAQSDAYKAFADVVPSAVVSQEQFLDALKKGDFGELRAKVDAYAQSVLDSGGDVTTATQFQDLFTAAIGDTTPKLGQLQGIMGQAGTDAGNFGKAADDAAQRQRSLGEGADAAAAGVAQVGASAEEAVPPMEALGTATDAMGKAQTDATAATDFLTAALDRQQGNALSVEEAQRNNEAAYRATEAAQRDLSDAHTAAIEAQTKVNEMTAAGTTSGTEYEAAVRAQDEAVAALGDASDGLFKSQMDVRQSALDAAGAAAANQLATGDMEGAARSANAVMDVQRARFMASASEADRLSGAAEQTANKLFGIPGEVGTLIAQDGAAAVQQAAQATTTTVNEIPDSHNTELTATTPNRSTVNDWVQQIGNVPARKVTIFEGIIAGATPPGGFTGGKVRGLLGFASGGRLPGTPPSDPRQDNLLAFGPGGRALAVRSREWLVNEPASDFYGDAMMADINARRFPKPQGYVKGGKPGGSITPAAVGAGPGDVYVQVQIGTQGIQTVVDASVERGFSGATSGFSLAKGQGGL